MMLNGPIVATQDASKVHTDAKGLQRDKDAGELYEILCKHLNFIQVYICGKGYLIQHTGTSVEKVLQTIASTVNDDQIVNKRVMDRLQGMFKTALDYADTPRDKHLLKGPMAEITSIKLTARLQGVDNRQGTASANKALRPNLQQHLSIKTTPQIVRSDLTTKQQHTLTQRIIPARKHKEMRVIAEGRGRKLKASEFPELASVLEYAFGSLDVDSGGRGLEAHPRLTTGTLYRGADNATTMIKAQETLLSLAHKGFSISLSSCYNYTEKYRRGTAQEKRHHFGQGVNADVSLKKPPRTGVEELVINLHWATANVNHIDSYQNGEHALVISKDAKAIIPSGMAPVQLPGPSWRKREELPDHTWDQSRTNAVTPMTFLFLETRVTKISTQSIEELHVDVSPDTTLHVTRSGQGVTFLYLSFELDTTFKCMNEVLLLLSLPALDKFFRDARTGQLKSEFTFVVDNGPTEQPCSPLVQMCLVRYSDF